jgi:uncharacterized membrane-anchored protein YitT (DUF2179 family)
VSVCGLNLFLVPNKIAAGGISGIATILYHVFGFPLGVTIAVLNVLYSCRLQIRGQKLRHTHGLRSRALFAACGVHSVPAAEDMFLGCVYGGVLMGAGIGVVVRSGGSTGAPIWRRKC